MNDTEEARQAQYLRADRILEHFFSRHQADIRNWRLEAADQQFLRGLTLAKLSGRPLLSSSIVRQHLAYAWIDALLGEHEDHPDRDRVWITMAWDGPLTWERAPKIDTISLRNIANQHLRRCGIEGAGSLEVDSWKEIPGEPGKRVVPHIHFLGWSRDGQKINVDALAESMCRRRALHNSLDAPSVVVKEVGKSANDLATLGYYLSKPPAYAKNPVPRRTGEGYKLLQVEHAPGSVTRLIEMLSFMAVGDVIFSIGEGKTIARKIRDRAMAACAQTPRAFAAPSHDMIERHWRRIRLNNGNKKFSDCRIITRADQRSIIEPDY